MRWFLISFLITFSSLICIAQPPIPSQAKELDLQDNLLETGRELYHLEMASRLANQIIVAYQEISFNGFIPILNEDSISVVFWKKETASNRIVSLLKFLIPPAKDNYRLSTENRVPTQREKLLIDVKSKTLKLITESAFFKHYDNSYLQPIVVEKAESLEVHVLTFPEISTSILFGNDYKLTFNMEGDIISKEIISSKLEAVDPYIEPDKDNKSITQHEHPEGSPWILSATDICTLLLYKPYVNWTAHQVVSEHNVSTFDIVNEGIMVVERKD